MVEGYPIGTRLRARDLWVDVPLDWENPDGETIAVFAREVWDPQCEPSGLPVLLYLQGGPGGKSPRVVGDSGFVAQATRRFRVVLLDQRGTGKSTPVLGAHFAAVTDAEGARRLALYRADSIIRDCEALRERHFGGQRWHTLGQSYGGFLTLQYLSMAPEALVSAAITGGVPGIAADAETVYERTFPRMLTKNQHFADRYPWLCERIARVADVIAAGGVWLPDGSELSVQRLQTLGMSFGMSTGYEQVFWLFDEAFSDRDETVLSPTFLSEVAHATGYATNPLYVALQEAIYGPSAANWAAERVRQRYPAFAADARPLLFTGEAVFPWMLEELPVMRDFAGAVRVLASEGAPMPFYDAARLAANEVPIEAAVYFDDMYVDAELSFASLSGIGNAHAWVTNEYEHDGLRQGDVADRLFDALRVRLAQEGRSI